MLLDTNILVRHLTGEPTDQADRATTLLRNAESLELPSLIVAELVYVLESVYEQTRSQVAALVRSALAHPPVAAPEEAVLLRAIELHETCGSISPRHTWLRLPSGVMVWSRRSIAIWTASMVSLQWSRRHLAPAVLVGRSGA